MSDLEQLVKEVRTNPVYVTERALLDFADQLDAAMRKADMSQTTLGIKAKCGRSQVWRVMNCEHGTTVSTLGKIANALGMDLEIKLVERSKK